MQLLDTVSGRWYQVGGRVVPSVTTILNVLHKPMLTEWKLKQGYKSEVVVKEALKVGDVVHDVLCRLTNGEEVELEDYYHISGKDVWINDEILKAITSAVEWFKDVDLRVVAAESELSHPEIGWAGTCDLVCKIKNKKGVWERWLIDYKTSKQLDDDTLPHQLTAYALLWNACYPDEPIEKVGGLHCKKAWVTKPAATLKQYKINESLWKAVYTIFEAQNNKPRVRYDGPRVFSLSA